MGLEMISPSGFKITLVARIRLLSIVLHHVVPESNSLSGFIIAKVAFVQFLATVNKKVGLQSTIMGK